MLQIEFRHLLVVVYLSSQLETFDLRQGPLFHMVESVKPEATVRRKGRRSWRSFIFVRNLASG